VPEPEPQPEPVPVPEPPKVVTGEVVEDAPGLTPDEILRRAN
jgi:hypothetical protein